MEFNKQDLEVIIGVFNQSNESEEGLNEEEQALYVKLVQEKGEITILEEKGCDTCNHGKMCSLRRALAEANQKVNYMVAPNDLAKICFEYKKKEKEE